MQQKLIIGIACLLAGLIAGWLINGWRLSASYSEEKAEAVQANADHFVESTQDVNDSANEYLRKTKQLKVQITELEKELANAKKNSPLPADCRPDSDRLRVLKDAVTAANTAIRQ